jgi:hypothetical protein
MVVRSPRVVSYDSAIHTASLTGLAPGQVYYVRVISINSAGRGAPTVAAFADAGTPAIAPWLAADAIPVGSVQLSTLPASGDVVGVGESSSSLKVIHFSQSLRIFPLSHASTYANECVGRCRSGRRWWPTVPP